MGLYCKSKKVRLCILKKRFLTSLIFGLCIFVLCGCANVEASVKYVVQDGSAIIVQAVDVFLDREALEQAKYDYDNAVSQLTAWSNKFMEEKESSYTAFLREIATNQTKYAQSINKRFKNSLETFSYLNTYKIIETDSGFRIQKEFGNIYCFMVYNDYNMFFVGCPICQAEINIDVDKWESNRQNGIINSYLCPNCENTINDYEYYFESRLIDIPLDGKLSVEQNLFVTNYLQECSTMFKDINNLKFKDGTRLIDAFAQVFRGGTQNFDLQDANLIYKFITPYKRVHSNGTITKENGYWIHSWNITDPATTIILSRTTTNTTMWYVVGLSCAVGFVIIYFAVYLICRTVKNKSYKSTHPPHKESARRRKKIKQAEHNNLIDIIK